MPASNSGYTQAGQDYYPPTMVKNIKVLRRKQSRALNTGNKVIPGTSSRMATISVQNPTYLIGEEWELSYEVEPNDDKNMPPFPKPLTDPALVLIDSVIDPVHTQMSDDLSHVKVSCTGRFLYQARVDQLVT